MASKPQTLVDLAQKFDNKLTILRESFDLVHARGEPAVIDLSKSVGTTLLELEVILTVMRAELKQRRKALNRVEEIKRATGSHQESIEHMLQNLPTHLPKRQVSIKEPQLKTKRLPSVKTPPARPGGGYHETPMSAMPSKRSSNTPIPSTEQIKQRSMGLFLPTIEYLTTEEFNSVPKYMKGRHTYTQINHMVDEFNKALAAKYKLINTAKSRQNEPIKRKIRVYKEQETKDTKGQYFVIDKDIIEHSNMKLDSVGRAMLTILRHCRRIKEVRGKGLARYMTL